jgi:DHA2 family multidrug resistance protein
MEEMRVASRQFPEPERSAALKNPPAIAVKRRTTTRFATSLISPDRASYKWWVAATVTLSAFLVVMNNATTNVALPRLMTAFGMNLDEAQWIITAYMIAGATMVPTVGWLGNRLGNRNLFVLGLLVFLGSSALCGVAWSGPSLVFFRVLQGLGGGPITPMTMVFLTNAFPPHQRGLAMGLYGMGMSFGPALGPVLGGYVTEYLHWRMVFFMNVAPGLVCLALALLVIPGGRETIKRTLDVAGLLTLTIFLVSLLVALSQGHQYGWDAPYIRRLFVLAAVALAAFISRELLCQEPLVDLRLYKSLAFTAVSLAALITSMNFWGTGFLQTILLQRLLDYTPAQAGFVMLPGALGMAITTLGAGRLADKVDRRYVVLGGLSLFALATYWFSFLTLERSMGWVTWMIVLRYISVGFVFTPMNAASMVLLPPDKIRMGSGLLNLMQQGLGGSTSLAAMTTILQHRITYHATRLDEQQVLAALSASDMLGPIRDLVGRAGELGATGEIQALGLLHQYLEQQATVAAYQDCFVLMTILCLVGMPLVLFLRRQTP